MGRGLYSSTPPVASEAFSSMSLALPKQTITASQGPQAPNERHCGNTNATVLSCLSHNRLWDSMQQLTYEASRSMLISPT